MVANANNEPTPLGVWLNAEEGEFAGLSKTGRPQVKSTGSGTLSYRPGWHLGDIPRATQFDRTNKETGEKEFPKDFVWAECEYAMDVDYQKDSDEQGYMRTKADGTSYKSDKYQHSLAGLPRLPKNGCYRYRTNPRPDTVPWVITGAIKVKRLLDDAEVNEILKSKGIEPIHRQGGDKTLAELGLSQIKESVEDLGENMNEGCRDARKVSMTEEAIANFKDEKITEEDYKGFTIKHFPYTLYYGDEKEDVESWLIMSPYYTQNSAGKKTYLPLYPEDENGEDVDFNSVESAKEYIDKYMVTKRGKVKIKHGDEAHYVIDDEITEDLDNEQPDFEIIYQEVDDEEAEPFGQEYKIGVDKKEVVDRYGQKAYDFYTRGVTKEDCENGLPGMLLGMVETIASEKFRKEHPHMLHSATASKLVNKDIFPSGIEQLQKKLGKILLPH